MAVAFATPSEELERQQRVLDELPDSYPYPLFAARPALESARDSGYRSTASAARELIDNGLEAGADHIWVVFHQASRTRGPRAVDAIAFIDDGVGMVPGMARYALSWGGGTHYEDPGTIGKFGFGLPNASINQCRRTEVYTRTAPEDPIRRAVLDIDTFGRFDRQGIGAEEEVDGIPKWLATHMKRAGIKWPHGTIVVWNRPDRLTYSSVAGLKDHLVDDFSIVYRHLLGVPAEDAVVQNGADSRAGVVVQIEDQLVAPTDPLFLLPWGRLYVAPSKGGAEKAADLRIPVTWWKEEEGSRRRLTRTEDGPPDPEGWVVDATSSIQVIVSSFPYHFAVDKGRRKGNKDASNLRFDVRRDRRGISWVRGPREIETMYRFPPASKAGQGLGKWPSIQGYAYHWACEVRFGLDLDEAFGIANDKQSVRPTEDAWRVLAAAGLDGVLRAQNRRQMNVRRKSADEQDVKPDEPRPAEQAAADVVKRQPLRMPESMRASAKAALESEAARRAAGSGASVKEERTRLQEDSKRRPFRVDFYESEDGPIYKPEWQGQQMVLYINRSHPFYQEVYAPLSRFPGAMRMKEGVDLLLLGLVKGELETEDPAGQQWYSEERKQVWSRFVESAAGWLDVYVRASGTEADGAFEDD